MLQRLDLRAFIGKGELAGTDELCKEHKCLRLITIGTWNDFACNVRRVVDVAWLDLGASEAANEPHERVALESELSGA
jgi:tartrate dehydratase beta subunit/fumarate hydratase class I family protein